MRRAALIVPWRRGGATEGTSGLEIFLVARSPELKFYGGHHSFPGGGIDSGDAQLPVAGETAGLDREIVACAARELFEETGVLAVTSDTRAIPEAALSELRSALLERESDSAALFARFLREHGLHLAAGQFRSLARLVTPRFSPLRFDGVFLLRETRESPSVLPGELKGGEWWSPAAAIEAWRRGRLRLAPPAIVILKTFAEKPFEAAVTELRGLPAEFEGSGRAIPLAPGYEVLPLATPPLPRNIPTSTFLVGERSFVVIDPGPKREVGRTHLLAAVDERVARGDELLAIVLTHHHPDHVGALDAVESRYGAPVWAHPRTAELLELAVARELRDGDTIALGRAPDGTDGWELQAVFTPGHAEGHLAFYDAHHASLIAGDLLSTLVSMYVGSPGGSLSDYFASLRRVAELRPQVLYPAHGAASRDPLGLIASTLEHRRARMEQVAELLTPDEISVEALAARVYPDTTDRLRPLIVRATRAALEYLETNGRCVRSGEDTFHAPASR